VKKIQKLDPDARNNGGHTGDPVRTRIRLQSLLWPASIPPKRTTNNHAILRCKLEFPRRLAQEALVALTAAKFGTTQTCASSACLRNYCLLVGGVYSAPESYRISDLDWVAASDCVAESPLLPIAGSSAGPLCRRLSDFCLRPGECRSEKKYITLRFES